MQGKSQKERIIKKLLTDGYITRNECLSTFPAITRLGAIICTLKSEGWDFETKNVDGDYMYKTIKCPLKKETLFVPSIGKTIERYVEK